MNHIIINPEDLAHGLYELWWNEGGMSEAAVGSNRTGETWYAPINWVIVPSYDWSKVKRVVRIR